MSFDPGGTGRLENHFQMAKPGEQEDGQREYGFVGGSLLACAPGHTAGCHVGRAHGATRLGRLSVESRLRGDLGVDVRLAKRRQAERLL